MKNLKKLFFLIILIISVFFANAQQNINLEGPYNPDANAKADIQNAINKAKIENKHVFVQIGGNWCSWCLMLHKFYSEDSEIDSIMNADYIKVMLNYSRENKNLNILANMGYPQRFGFPVLVILNGEGKVLHIQNTVYLEEERGYNKKKFTAFLKNWNKNALNPKNYVN